MSDCIFCKIINGEIPATKVYEDDKILAFLDISQVTKGHTLVVPKDHVANIYEINEDTLADLFRKVPKLATALTSAFEACGLNIVNNNGPVAGQSVFHYHVHLVPRYGSDDGFKQIYENHSADYTREDLAKIAAKIKEQL